MTRDVPWRDAGGPNRVAPRECIAAARDALSRAYSYSEAPWPLIAEAVDWQRRALEQMIGVSQHSEPRPNDAPLPGVSPPSEQGQVSE